MFVTSNFRRMTRCFWAAVLLCSFAGAAFAQAVTQYSAAPLPSTTTMLQEVVVTAQKRQQSIQSVPMSIVAATGAQLRERGITSMHDLPNLVPGLTVQDGSFDSTSYTLRGVGFNNSDLGTPPDVSVYMDQAPIPFPAMTTLAAFDLARVEVLEGPQGTLYGENATGGLVDFIPAQPTQHFDAGADVSYGRFDRTEDDAFISGPITDTLTGRLALSGEKGGPWQVDVIDPAQRLGRISNYEGRGILNWQPNTRFRSHLTFMYTHDGSETPAAQFIAPAPVDPALAVPGLMTFPVVQQPRAASWTLTMPNLDGTPTNTPFPYASDTNLYWLSWQNNYQLSDRYSLTSMTMASYFRQRYGMDSSGTPFLLNDSIDTGGRIGSYYEELRLNGDTGWGHWIVGANYEYDNVSDSDLDFFRQKDLCNDFVSTAPEAYCDSGTLVGRQHVQTTAVFAHDNYDVTRTLSLQSGVRFTDDRRTFDNCGLINTTHFADYFDIFQSLINGGVPISPLAPGDCYVLNPENHYYPVNNVHVDLDQTNVSWVVGPSWKPLPGLMLYATVSKGYKAGTIPIVGAASVDQYKPVPQESLLSYEVGFKSTLLDDRMQLNGATFYYDYTNKQLRGDIPTLIFGPLEALVSIPKSYVEGSQMQLIAEPINGLVFNASAIWLHTWINQFTGYDALGNYRNLAGTAFPYAPNWESDMDVSYRHAITDRFDGFIGATANYHGKTFAGVGADPIESISPYVTLDMRGGIETLDGHYRVMLWGKNITNKYYWTNVFQYENAISRFVGDPMTYGITFSYRY